MSFSLVTQPREQPSPAAPQASFTPEETAAHRRSIVRVVISPREAYGLIIENKDNPDFIILDVRSPEEYATGHIEDAVNIDFYIDERTNNTRTFRGELSRLDRNKTYLVYCLVDIRSRVASDIMEHLGFVEVYDMAGGILQWKAEGLPTVE
ncbi:rhodanese-like domain-containing protein [Candidatus Bathyarchaeota archaeon]|nr:rhodanese-like domain-containing protein [Candidatus Bathyarchaeota archaeon]